jgi:Flp pilus assembly protein TadD
MGRAPSLVRTRVGAALRFAALGACALSLGCALGAPDVPALKSEAREAFAEGRPTDALQTLRTAVALAPDDAEAHYLLGVMALRSDRTGEAEVALARAAELAPRDARTLAAWGLALRAQKRWEEAESALVRSLLLRPGDPSTLAALGELYRLSGQPEKCAVRYEQFVWQLEQSEPQQLDPQQQRALDSARERARECAAAAAAAQR